MGFALFNNPTPQAFQLSNAKRPTFQPISKYTYFFLDAFTLLGPLALSFDKKVAFRRSWSSLLRGLLPTAAFFIFWDVLFTRWGIWGFNYEYLTRPSLFGLPLEEWVFFFVVPYACAFIYACVKAYGKWNGPDKGIRATAVLGGILLLTGIVFWQRAYTLYAFGGCGFGLLLSVALRRFAPRFRFDVFLFSYVLILVPFLLVNGVLTALPVVIYNDAENLARRIYTIPVEDTFYGMLMVLGTVFGMQVRAKT